jgi:hypothetical protein
MNTLASNRSNKSSKALVATPTTRPIVRLPHTVAEEYY